MEDRESEADPVPTVVPKVHPESLKNLRRGSGPSERQVEAGVTPAPLKAPEPDPGPLEDQEGMSDQLRDMLHVYRRPKKTDGTPGQRACRKWFDESPGQFLAAKAKLEEAWLVGRRATSAPSVDPVDAALDDATFERCLGLVEKCLKERMWEKKQ